MGAFESVNVEMISAAALAVIMGLSIILLGGKWCAAIKHRWSPIRGGVRIQVLDVKWFGAKAGCILLSIEERKFLVAVGEARDPVHITEVPTISRPYGAEVREDA